MTAHTPGSEDHLSRSETVLPIHGISMLPLLREGKDTVVLKELPVDEMPAIGDVILFERGNQKVLHRIIGIDNRFPPDNRVIYSVRGDNCIQSEPVGREQILAVMTAYVKNGKTVRADDEKYQKYVRKMLKRDTNRHKKLIWFRNRLRRIKRFLAQDSIYIRDNGQYMYNTGSAGTILSQLSKTHHKEAVPYLRIIEDGIILPRKRFTENGIIIDKGGVVDRDLNYIEESREYDYGGKYDFDLSTVQESDDSVIYLGRGFPHYGVILSDLLRRAYFMFSDNGRNMKLCFCGIYSEPGTFGSHDRKVWELLSALGFSKTDLIDIRSPVRFKKIYIPEPAFEYDSHYTDELRIPYKTLYDKVEAKDCKKVYLSRGKTPQRKEAGEPIIEKFFRMNGFYILYPDEADIYEQVRVLKGAECIASVEGTGSYNILFCSPGTRQIIIRRDSRVDPRLFLFDEMMQAAPVYIDCLFNFLPGFPRHYDIGPFCMLFNRNIRAFAKDNGYKIPNFWFFSNIRTMIRYCLLCISRKRTEKKGLAG